tara:strand:+ start:53 stop:265 length:213 start_codon:yes stop_codon:yes gene_type:complete
MKTVEKIEELLTNVEKKIHAGEWLRVEQVRMLMNEFGVWLIEQHQQDLRDIKRNILFPDNGSNLKSGEEE